MTNKMTYMCFITIIAASSLWFVGCATSMSNQASKNHKHDLQVSLHPTDHPFTNVVIRHRDGEVVLHGDVDHNHKYQEIDAHVDVAVVDNSGNVHYRGSVAISNAHVRGRYRVADFKLRFPETSTPETAVHVAYHSTKLEVNPQHDCDNNQAAEVALKTGE